MDKMTINMIAGAVLSSLLVLFGTSTFVDILYPRGGVPEAPVEHAESATPGAEAAAGASQPLPVLLASAKVDAGAAQAKKCASCHTFEQGGENKVGPPLYGVVGRPVASHEGYAYSAALKSYGGNWDYERLSCFIHDPKACVSGTKMAFAGVKKDTDRADIIAYLRSVTPNAPPLPAPQEGAAAPAATQDAGAASGAAPAAPQEGAAAPAATQDAGAASGAGPAAAQDGATAPAATQDAGAASGAGPATGGGTAPAQASEEAPAGGPQATPGAQGSTQ